jgi:type IV fimbrial biogenesis protein FimT
MKPAAKLRRGRPRGRAGGFTLIELMVTVTLAAVIMMLAAPSFNNALLSNKLAAFANNFVASAQLARSEAIKRNRPVHICRSADGASCAASGTWQQGWIVWSDDNRNGALDAGETVVQVQQTISADYEFTSTAGTYDLAFQPVGGGSDAATLKLCRALPQPGNQERQVKIDATGRPSVTTLHLGTCP